MIKYITVPSFLNADNTYVFNLVPGESCRKATREEFVSKRQRALKPFLSSLTQVVYSSQFAAWPKAKRDSYLGVIVDTPAEYAAVIGVHTDGSFSEKPKSRFKDWLSAKKDGSIIFRPMEKYRYKARELASFTPINPKLTLSALRSGGLRESIGVIGPSHCNSNNDELLGFEDFAFHGSALTLRSPEKREQLSNISGQKYFASESELDLFVNKAIRQLKVSNHKVDSNLVTAVRSAANSGTYDLLTEVAEMPETVKYLYGVIREIVTLFRGTRKKVLQLTRKRRLESEAEGAAKLASEIASLWLQFRYAVMPLCYSANDMLDLLSVQTEKYLTYRDGMSTQATINLFGDDYTVELKQRCLLKRRFGLDGTTTLDHLKLDILATAWELVPLSFIVDWAFNVGDFLSSIGVPAAVSQEACTYSWKTSASLTVTTPVNSTLSIDFELYEVDVINPSAHIGLNLDVFMNIERTLDALALSWTMFRGKR